MDLLHKYTSHSSSVIPCCSGGVFLSGPTSVSVFDSTLAVVHGVALKYLLVILRGSGVRLWVFLFTAVSTYRTAASRWYSPTGKWSFLSHLCIFFFYSMPFKKNPHQSLPRLDIGDVNLLQTGHFPFCGVRSRLDSLLTDAVERSGLKNKKKYTNRFSLCNGWIHASVHPVIRQQVYYSVLLHCSLFCPILWPQKLFKRYKSLIQILYTFIKLEAFLKPKVSPTW